MKETEMIMTIAELKGKVNWMTKFLGDIKFLLDDDNLKENAKVKHILEVMEQAKISEFPVLNHQV